MLECKIEIVMKNGEIINQFTVLDGKELYESCADIAKGAHIVNSDVEKVNIRVSKGDKNVFKKTFVFSDLNEKQIKEINDWVNGFDIDEEDLESAKWCSNIYGVEPQYAVGGYTYDEDEYWNCQLAKALSYLDTDMAYEYFDFAKSEDEDEDEE